LGGEEDSPPRRLTTVNPSASVIELYIVGASISAVATNPSMEKIRRASFSSKGATSKKSFEQKSHAP
jgi:hypothetical protein